MAKPKPKPRKYCWDTSVFLAWLGNEESAPLSSIEMVLREVHHGNVILLVSVMTYTEILEAKHSPEQMNMFNQFMLRSNVQRMDTTFPIATKAGQIRSRCVEQSTKSAHRRLQSPDATIIATAIVHKADMLHTLDTRVWAYSESPIVDGLRICDPCLLRRDGTVQRAIGGT